MNREQEIERIIRLVHDMADDHVLRECIGKGLDIAYLEGQRRALEAVAGSLESALTFSAER